MRAKRRAPFADVFKWRAADSHTGIGKVRGIPYTHEDVPAPPHAGSEIYRVECYVPFGDPMPIHRNVYYVPAGLVDRFFDGWDKHAETIVDVRPITAAPARAELTAFRAAASKGGSR